MQGCWVFIVRGHKLPEAETERLKRLSLEAVTGFRYFPKLRHQFFLAEICVYAKCYFQYDDTVDTSNCNL